MSTCATACTHIFSKIRRTSRARAKCEHAEAPSIRRNQCSGNAGAGRNDEADAIVANDDEMMKRIKAEALELNIEY